MLIIGGLNINNLDIFISGLHPEFEAQLRIDLRSILAKYTGLIMTPNLVEDLKNDLNNFLLTLVALGPLAGLKDFSIIIRDSTKDEIFVGLVEDDKEGSK